MNTRKSGVVSLLGYFTITFFLCCLIRINAIAQTYPYTITFETGVTHPASKSYASADTILLDSIPWTMPGVFLGSMTGNDLVIGNHAARFRLTNNTSGNPAYMSMLEDLPMGMQSVSFYTGMYRLAHSDGKLLVLYSTDSGQSWQPAGDTIVVSSGLDSLVRVTVTHPISSPLRLKIQKTNTQNNRIDVDSIVVRQFGYGQNVLLQQHLPSGPNVSIYSDSLKLIFDHNIQAYQGQIRVHRSGGNVQTISILSSQVSIQDSMAIVTGIQIQDNSHYYVTLTDSAFHNVTDNLFSLPIVDSTTWQFTTEDTIAPPHIPPLTGLNETFLACNEEQNLMGLFRFFNVAGSETWQCDNQGHGDSFAVSISGGFGNHVSAENEDWLISELPFDLSQLNHPILSFWQRSEFNGQVTRTVKISYDYPGFGSPTDSNVHWITLNIPGINLQPGSQWNLVNGIGLDAFKDSTFYLAFTYSCGTNGAYKLFYDDIHIGAATSVAVVSKDNFSAVILGTAKNGMLHIRIQSNRSRHLLIEAYSSIGKIILQQKMTIKSGLSYPSIRLPVLASGIYFLKIEGKQVQQFLRFIVAK